MSNETKWTPGPWVIDHDNNIVVGANCVADPWDFDVGEEQCAANAHLIAAAPELYSLLDELLGVASEYIQGNHYEELFDNCEKTLAKARGETP